MASWKWIIYQGHDFTDKYMISDEGQVKSVDKYTEVNRQFFKGRIIKQRDGRKHKTGNCYKVVTLWDNGVQVDVEVHRLVATAFIENAANHPCVNHIDGDRANNNVTNLEWCTYQQNVQHSIQKLGNNPKNWKAKKIIQRTLDGEYIREWESGWEIQRQLGYCQVSISRCCRGEKKGGSMYGYLWEFAG